MAEAAIKVQGIKETIAKLKDFDQRVQKKAMRKGYRAAGNIVRDEARARAPIGRRGRIKKAISTSVNVKADGSGRVKVGAKAKSGARHAHLQELGVSAHDIRARKATRLAVSRNRRPRQVRHPGHRAQPFLFPALEARQGDAVGAFRDAIDAEIRGMS